MVDRIMDILYTAEATSTGGRAGHAESSDGRLKLEMSVPSEMGGDGGPGTNPEQLFAAGYAACFQGALGVVARREKVSIEGSTITVDVGIGPDGKGGFGLQAGIAGHIPGLDATRTQDLLDKAHQVCPYSNATRGNIEVTVRAADA